MGDKWFSRLIRFLIANWYFIVILMLVIFISGRSTVSAPEEQESVEKEGEYKIQKSLNLPCESFDTLNPLISESEDVYYISKLIYDSLFTFDENMAAVPSLVSSYTVNTSKAYIDIELRKDVKFHSGVSLKASDVAFTVNAIRAAGAKSPYYRKIKKINSVYVRNDHSLIIYFKNNMNCSLDDLVFPVVSSSGYSTPEAFAATRNNFKPCGTGQFQYKSCSRKKYIKLVSNEKYFGEKSDKTLYFRILPDRSFASNMLEIREVTCYMDDSNGRKTKARDKNFFVCDVPSGNIDFIVLNTKKTLMSKKNFRRALLSSVDRNSILREAYVGDGIIPDTIYYPGFMGIEDTGDVFPYDNEHAEVLFDKCGLSDKNSDGLLEDSNGNKVTVDILVNKNNPSRNYAAKQIKRNLLSSGISSQIHALPADEYKTSVKSRDFDILITGYTINEDYDLRCFFNGRSEWGYYNYKTLSKVQKLDRLYTEDKYREFYSDIKKSLEDDAVYCPLCCRYESLIGVDTFTAEEKPIYNNIYKGIATWSWSKLKEKD